MTAWVGIVLTVVTMLVVGFWVSMDGENVKLSGVAEAQQFSCAAIGEVTFKYGAPEGWMFTSGEAVTNDNRVTCTVTATPPEGSGYKGVYGFSVIRLTYDTVVQVPEGTLTNAQGVAYSIASPLRASTDTQPTHFGYVAIYGPSNQMYWVQLLGFEEESFPVLAMLEEVAQTFTIVE